MRLRSEEPALCKSCKRYYGRNEFSMDGEFIRGAEYTTLLDGHRIKVPSFRTVMEGGFGMTPITMCQHESCFKNGERIRGQGQLVVRGRCQHYRRGGRIRRGAPVVLEAAGLFGFIVALGLLLGMFMG